MSRCPTCQEEYTTAGCACARYTNIPIPTRAQAEFLQGGEYGPQLRLITELLKQILAALKAVEHG